MKNKLIIFFLCILAMLSVGLIVLADDITEDDSIIEDIKPPCIFVSGNGNDTNDGLTDKTPVNTFEKAYELLSEDGGIVVVCGKITIDKSTPSLPKHEKSIEITSYYDGVDYKAKKGAEIYIYDTLNIYGPAETYIYGVKIHSESTANIFCNGSSVRFGARVESECDNGTYPSIYGGMLLNAQSNTYDGNFSDFTLEINTGYWHHVTLGNLRADKSAPMSEIKNSKLKINGGTFVASDNELYTTSCVSGAKTSGNIEFVITGGLFYGSVYVIGNEGDLLPNMDLKYDANVYFSIESGSFMGNYIKALYSKNASLFGKYVFSVENGSFSSLIYVGCEGVYSDITLNSCEAVQNKLYGFEKVVFVSKDGDDNNSGESVLTPKKTLSGAFAALQSGGTIVICSEITLPDGFTTRISNSNIKITSKYYDTDYKQTKKAVLNVEGNVNLQSNIKFENITLKTTSAASIHCYGKITEFGQNVVTEGDVSIHLKKNSASHTISIASGNFSLFEFESSDVSTFISIIGGYIELFRGCTEMHKGDIFVDFSGGVIGGDINIAPKGILGNQQLIVGNTQIQGSITSLRPDTEKLSEALVVYNYDKSKISGFDIIQDNYVFVRDGAIGNGSTPSLAAPTIEAALSYIGQSNACVIICGKVTHSSEYKYQNVGILTYSSVYRNIDFSSINGAKLILESDYYFDNDATIENIVIETRSSNISFHCNSHIVKFGYGIRCQSFYPISSYYPSIIANDNIPNSPYNTNGESVSDKLIISGGIWNNVYASASTDILGGVIKGSLYGTKDLSNDCNIKVFDGIIYGGIYASIEAKENASSNINIAFAGGEIHGIISPSYFSSVGYTGKYLIIINAGDFSGIDKIVEGSFIGGEKSYVNVDTSVDMTVQADSFITYQNPISYTASSFVFHDSYWYLIKESCGKVQVYKSNTVSSISYTKPISEFTVNGQILSIDACVNSGKLYVFAKILDSGIIKTNIYFSDDLNENVTFATLSGTDMEKYDSPFIYTYNGEKYLFYSNQTNSSSDIYCAKIDGALNLLSEPVKIIGATQKWENGQITSPRILSAPNGKIYLVYTGGNVYGGSSMLGICEIIASDLLREESYLKNPDPVFYESEEFSNIVLSSILEIDGSTEPYIVFSARYKGKYMMFLQSYAFDENGVPYFMGVSDISMLYLAHYVPKSLETLLNGFIINDPEIFIDDKHDNSFSIIAFLQQNSILILSSAFVMIFILIIVLIKKYSQDPKVQFKKNQKQRTRNERRRASRLKAGRTYAANLEKMIAEQEAELENKVSEKSKDEQLIQDIEELIAAPKDDTDTNSTSSYELSEISETTDKVAEDDQLKTDDAITEVSDIEKALQNEESAQSISSGLIESMATEEEQEELAIVGANVKQNTESEQSSLDLTEKRKRPRPTRRI